jgi:hypothetical protein
MPSVRCSHKDLAFVVRNTNEIPDASSSYTCYVFQCESSSAAADLAKTLKDQVNVRVCKH